MQPTASNGQARPHPSGYGLNKDSVNSAPQDPSTIQAALGLTGSQGMSPRPAQSSAFSQPAAADASAQYSDPSGYGLGRAPPSQHTSNLEGQRAQGQDPFEESLLSQINPATQTGAGQDADVYTPSGGGRFNARDVEASRLTPTDSLDERSGLDGCRGVGEVSEKGLLRASCPEVFSVLLTHPLSL